MNNKRYSDSKCLINNSSKRLRHILSLAPAKLRDMKVALHSNDLSADGISFTLRWNPGFVEETVGLIFASDAAAASDCFDTNSVTDTLHWMFDVHQQQEWQQNQLIVTTIVLAIQVS